MIKRTHTLYAAAMLALSAAAFAPAIASAQVGVSVVIRDAPPPPRYERVPAPRHGYVWAPGYWDWRGNRHHWIGGTWVTARPGYVYMQPRWEQRDGRWYRQEARWDRGPNGDRDHDGVPNRYDRHDNRGDHRGYGDKDHDGVPNRYDRDRDGDGVPNRADRHPDNRRRD
ncbi:YXWGXW repeat-containing protein [Duganella aceris]|jgi:hypothetical protein|uniref:BcpO-related WXXGXW repeat protein n=1 Tax=Duganella aceris TaxID=2703883 RepID=A0ABX0FG85_9BURK|nr:YXWGXW repeat-containing protein [Duganella aceris]NGZ83556.1 BcpO-related WXXGXW repeat protein [Duganella aceris]